MKDLALQNQMEGRCLKAWLQYYADRREKPDKSWWVYHEVAPHRFDAIADYSADLAVALAQNADRLAVAS